MSEVSFHTRLRQLAADVPERSALLCGGADISYAQLWQRIERATERLAREWKVAPGERIAYLGLNHDAQLVLLAALMRIGALLVPLNYRLSRAELRAIVAHAGVTQLIADEQFATIASALGPVVRERAALDAAPGPGAAGAPGGAEVASLGSRAAGAPAGAEVDAQSPALLVYTSGTTGRPKGAVHTHGGLYWNALASIAMHDFTAGDTVLTALPLFHVGGLCIQTLPALYAGARVILHPRFDPGAWLDALERERPTVSLMVPATMRAVQEHPRWRDADLSSLRLLGAGSSTIPDTLIDGFHRRGIPVCQIYGATETGPVSIVLSADEAFAHAGAAGRPALNCAIRLVGEHGDIEDDGAVGEIWVRGPNVMQGYWRDPDNAAYAGGWFHTGDLAWRDSQGYYTVVGRAQDMIISGGENIYPAEIENVLAGMAEIAEATVLGVPDPQWGEVPVAVIVLRAGAALSEAVIRARFDGVLARFKQPRRIVFRATLPRNAMGKVIKSELIESLSPQAGQGL